MHPQGRAVRGRTTESVRTLGEQPTAAVPGTVLGRYRLTRRLGAGGFGVVYAAHDEQLDREVAVKRIVCADATAARRAEREARAAARLAHPGIVALYEAARDDEAVYLVSELVEGRSLAELEREGLLSDRDVLRAGVALCDALAHAHRRGVVHRDVKPANVLVPDAPAQGSGVAKLTDFGVASMGDDDALTAPGDVVGTLAYMAPEQAAGGPVDARADVYALGLVLFEALAGVNPVRARGAAATARRVGARLPSLGRLRRDLPLDLCAAVDAAVRPDPAERPDLRTLRGALAAAAPEVADEAGTIAGSPLEAVAAVPAPATQPAPTPVLARFLAAAGAAGVVAAVLGWPAPATATGAPAVAPVVAASVAAATVLLLPALGWTAVALALAVVLTAGGAPGLAVVVLAAALPAVALLRGRAAVLRSAPAGAPLLGLAALAPAWPAFAGQAPRVLDRAALGLLGCWWLVLAELATGDRLLLGAASGAGGRAADPEAWTGSARRALEDAVGPALTGGALLPGLAWAAAAAVLPLLVRGRSFVLDVVAAVTWAAGTAAAVQALAAGVGGEQAASDVRGLVAGSVLAAVVAVGARAARAGGAERA